MRMQRKIVHSSNMRLCDLYSFGFFSLLFYARKESFSRAHRNRQYAHVGWDTKQREIRMCCCCHYGCSCDEQSEGDEEKNICAQFSVCLFGRSFRVVLAHFSHVNVNGQNNNETKLVKDFFKESSTYRSGQKWYGVVLSSKCSRKKMALHSLPWAKVNHKFFAVIAIIEMNNINGTASQRQMKDCESRLVVNGMANKMTQKKNWAQHLTIGGKKYAHVSLEETYGEWKKSRETENENEREREREYETA